MAFDAIVLGARCAGSPTAMLLARKGYRVLVVDQVVVAMSNYQSSRLPAFAAGLRPDIVQIHSRDYKNPAQLRDGGVLIVGAGN